MAGAGCAAEAVSATGVIGSLLTHEPGDRWSEGVPQRLDEGQRHLRPPGQPADGEVTATLGLIGAPPFLTLSRRRGASLDAALVALPVLAVQCDEPTTGRMSR